MLVVYIYGMVVPGRNLVARERVLVEILTTTSQPTKNLEIGKWANQKIVLCCVCYGSYTPKQTPEFCWATDRGYI